MKNIEGFLYRVTPHLKGSKGTFDDTFMNDRDTDIILKNDVLVQEKIDGVNIGLLFDDCQELIFIQKDKIISPHSKLITVISDWCNENYDKLFDTIRNEYVLFGELILNENTSINSWVIMDAIEKRTSRFVSYERLLNLIIPLDLNHIKILYKGKLNSIEFVSGLIKKSAYSNGKMEGVCIRIEEGEYTKEKYKFVREDFIKR